ncbi:MAG: YigZ family protein [Bacteroidaceae bacterium]|nr:YigZ family protein [Bacteroidaceae bacterium]
MQKDTYLTITNPAEGEYTEKRSKFLSFAFHVETAEEVKAFVDEYKKKFYDARHVCYAYMLGSKRDVFRAVDDGEPSGTAGKPILGQINSHELTDILIIVVRYFGGIKLGTSGLIEAYRAAAAEVISNADIEERTINTVVRVTYDYALMNQVMRVVKEEEPKIRLQDFQMMCVLELEIRNSKLETMLAKLRLIREAKTEVL